MHRNKFFLLSFRLCSSIVLLTFNKLLLIILTLFLVYFLSNLKNLQRLPTGSQLRISQSVDIKAVRIVLYFPVFGLNAKICEQVTTEIMGKVTMELHVSNEYRKKWSSKKNVP